MDHSYHSYFWKELSLFRDHIAVQQAWMNMLVAIPSHCARMRMALLSICKARLWRDVLQGIEQRKGPWLWCYECPQWSRTSSWSVSFPDHPSFSIVPTAWISIPII